MGTRIDVRFVRGMIELEEKQLQCYKCKFVYKNRFCKQWLYFIHPTIHENPTCSIPQTEKIYPKTPTLVRNGGRAVHFPTQHGRCFYCGAPLTGRQRSYCSKAHAHHYTSRYNWADIRLRVWGRDDEACKACGGSLLEVWEAEIDHITPVALGGAVWDYENLQTLCKQCHKWKTRVDRFRIKVAEDMKDNRLITEFMEVG